MNRALGSRLIYTNKSFFHKSERAQAKLNRENWFVECGLESLEQLSFANYSFSNCELSHLAINSAVAKLRAYQPLQSLTGAVHGAASVIDREI